MHFNALPPSILNSAITRLNCTAGGDSYTELVRAALAGDVSVLLFTDHRDSIAASDIWPLRRPALIVLGDDGADPTGPTGWRSAKAVLKWTTAVVVHGSGATPQTYAMALDTARAAGRAMMVETTSVHAQAWALMAAPKPTLLILPRDGVHPLQRVDEVAR